MKQLERSHLLLWWSKDRNSEGSLDSLKVVVTRLQNGPTWSSPAGIHTFEESRIIIICATHLLYQYNL